MTRKLKLIIQIPCYNEEETLPVVLKELPRKLDGIDTVEWMVIDDGSSDNTADIAKQCGVTHIIRHSTNRGLARAFMTGLHAALEYGADIIVNTDADNQYNAADIPALLAPILKGEAQYVIGARPISGIEHFSPLKKMLQKLGSKVVRTISGTNVADAPSGFRAITRDAALQLNVFSNYTYTLETIIQAGHKNIPIANVPVRVNGELRPSRLFKSMPAYIKRSIFTMIRIFIVYKPFKFFFSAGLVFFIAGLLLGTRFLWHYLNGNGRGMTQSLILTAVLLLMGTIGFMMAFVSDLLSVNRQLLEEIQYNLRKAKLDKQNDGSGDDSL